MPTVQAHKPANNFQAQFHRRWGHLNDPHVRALAWLLVAPDLLDPHAPQWQGKIAALPAGMLAGIDAWLTAMDSEPAELHRYLDLQPFARLGRYAEKLMAFYLERQNVLFAHSVQVRAGKNSTIGEFDFLLRLDDQLVHWEFATKFYLLESSGAGNDADYFVGPNLADTLGAKMHKILDRQLLLSAHPAAQIHLPEPVSKAQALVKGWLFYPDVDLEMNAFGTAHEHCRGFWCACSDLAHLRAERYAILPRLQWLAPASLPLSQTMDQQALQEYLAEYFVHDTMPVLVALLEVKDGVGLEVSRGFIVPDDWRTRAGQRIKLAHPLA
ncbi:DUF1853 family protein [Herminiimonas sp. NPDC097707]|uniref:DUF1853 family protein n=1 Tax=Herminiimonas sp. NPDC097707 TaxID=3364007 RepID=UPI00383BA0CA